MPADLDALPRLRRFRLRAMDRVKASLTRWRPEGSVAKNSTGLTSRVLPRGIGGNGASISGAGTSDGSDEKPSEIRFRYSGSPDNITSHE